MSIQHFLNETLEQQGSRHLQALLINPQDAYALHNMVRCFISSVKKQPSKCLTICPRLDAARRTLCAAAVQAQALISADSDAERVDYGIKSLERMRAVWQNGYTGEEDIGYWQNYILKPEVQLDRVLEAYIRLLNIDAALVGNYSKKLFVDLSTFWRSQHLQVLDQIRELLTMRKRTAANILESELEDLRKNLI